MGDESYKIRTLGEYQRAVVRFEKVNDGLTLPDLRLVVRIDARRYRCANKGGFCSSSVGDAGQLGHLATDSWDSWDYPYAPEIAEALVATARNLMVMGFCVTFAMVHGDEISLLFDVSEGLNPRKRSMLLSLVSSAGALHFRQYFPLPVIFHGVLSELPSDRHVIDYFFWQRLCFLRNFLSQAISRMFTEQGLSPSEIDDRVSSLSLDERIALLIDRGYPFNEQPNWKRFGIGLWWENLGHDTDGLESGGHKCRIVQSRYLPTTDYDFLVFLKQRLSGPTYLARELDCPVPFHDIDGCSYRTDIAQKSENLPGFNLPGGAKRVSDSGSTDGAFRIRGRGGLLKGRTIHTVNYAGKSVNTTIIKSK